jgi:phage terminase large subunit-like protein
MEQRKAKRKATSPTPDPVTKYCNDVLAGRIVAGGLARKACQRHLDDMRDGPERGLSWDKDAALRAIRFFPDVLCLPEIGTPFALEPWEQFVVGSLYGWKGPDGYRRFRTAYVEVGKGNGKSPLAGGIGIYMLAADREREAQCFAAATTQEQAHILFQDAVKMVQGSPVLRSRITTSGTRKIFNLAHPASGSFFRPISSEHKGLDGKRVHYAALDEIHEHPTSIVVDKMRAGTKGRRQALIFEITNSGYDRTSVCWNHHDYSRKVLEGVLENDSWFAYICGLDPCPDCLAAGKTQPDFSCKNCDDWRDPKIWPKANPNLGVSISHKYLEEQVAEAIGMPSKENIVKRLNFCIWTEQSERWMPIDKWDACGAPFSEDALRGEVCFGGLDLASTADFASFCRLFPPTDEREAWAALWRFYIPEAKLEERIRKDPGHSWSVWKDQGLLCATPGNIIDYDFIRADIQELAEQCLIQEIAFDRWNATQLVTQLGGDGFTMVPTGQGFASMNAPTSELMKLVMGKQLMHGGNPVARWMASNAAVEIDSSGFIKLSKKKSADKIDGMAALCDALSRAMVAPEGNYTDPEVMCV